MALKDLLLNFDEAIKLLELESLKDYQILAIINKTIPAGPGKKCFLSLTSFSNYRNASTKEGGLKKINIQTLSKLVKVLNEHILITNNLIWNGQKYIPKNQVDPKVSESRLQGLIGVWQAYSWDESKSDSSGIEHIHAFKIEIKSENEIMCFTKGTTFIEGSIELLGTEKVSMKIKHPERKIYIVIAIGSGQLGDLKRKKIFALAYVDSGNTNIKHGVALIERVTKEQFNQIEPESKPLNHFENTKDQIFFSFLRKGQKILTI